MYVVQGLWSDGRVCDEFNCEDEDTAQCLAADLIISPIFEAHSVRIITVDGEMVWDSRTA